MNIGTFKDSLIQVDIDFFKQLKNKKLVKGRDESIQYVLDLAKNKIVELYKNNEICGIISAGGGTGTYIASKIMHSLPLGVPKVMISTIASKDMSQVVGTKDITMMHSVVDLLGVNIFSAAILENAASAICAMTISQWSTHNEKKRIALSLFGFITEAAENIKKILEDKGYEIIPFHANGIGGTAMEEMADEGYFHGILDLTMHEFADELLHGFCRGIDKSRLASKSRHKIPRLVIPGGLDCAVLEFTKDNIPDEYTNRKIFFYDFRSAIRLNAEESKALAYQIALRLNENPSSNKILIPKNGWSEADIINGPLYDNNINDILTEELKKHLNPQIDLTIVDKHINDNDFTQIAAETMDSMINNFDFIHDNIF